jgi:hypothetical protein
MEPMAQADLSSFFCVMFFGAKAFGLGDVMHEGARSDHFKNEILPGLSEALSQERSHLFDHHGVGFDVFEHAVFFH